jgi:hypothetical protein
MVIQMFNRIQVERFLDSIIFSDESTFHVGGKVNAHNCRIWGSKNPLVSLEHVHDSQNVNVFCALSKEKVYGPFFMETTITGIVYLDMLQQFFNPQLDEDDQKRTYSLTARRRTPSLPQRSAQVPQHLFPRTLDW